MTNPEIIKKMIERIADGDMEAFGSFYNLYFLKVYRFSAYFVKSDRHREEVVSDVFYALWENRKNLLKIDNMEAYLYTVTRNKSLSFLKHLPEIRLSMEDLPSGYITDEETPEKILISAEIKKSISDAISSLPERCKLIYVMAREEGLKYREIADILQISEKTVNAQMVTALKRIIGILHDYFKGMSGD